MAKGHNFHFQITGRHLLTITQATTDDYILLMNSMKLREKQEQAEREIRSSHQRKFSYLGFLFPFNLDL